MIRWLCKLALAPARLQLPSPSNHEVKFAAASGRFQKKLTGIHNERGLTLVEKRVLGTGYFRF
jgi:hypothetical protein